MRIRNPDYCMSNIRFLVGNNKRAVLRIREFIPDPNFSISDPGSESKKLSIYNPKKLFLNSRKNDLECPSRIRILFPSRIQIRNTKKERRAYPAGSPVVAAVEQAEPLRLQPQPLRHLNRTK
jgi:hypothetical protein